MLHLRMREIQLNISLKTIFHWWVYFLKIQEPDDNLSEETVGRQIVLIPCRGLCKLVQPQGRDCGLFYQSYKCIAPLSWVSYVSPSRHSLLLPHPLLCPGILSSVGTTTSIFVLWLLVGFNQRGAPREGRKDSDGWLVYPSAPTLHSHLGLAVSGLHLRSSHRILSFQREKVSLPSLPFLAPSLCASSPRR